MKSIAKFLATSVLVAFIVFEIFYLIPDKPCAKPIPYQIGTFDTRFGISREYFLNKTQEAIDLWNDAVGKELFVYDPKVAEISNIDTKSKIDFFTTYLFPKKQAVTLNLIYDERQQTADTKKVLDNVINQGREQADAVKASYERLEAEYEVRAKIYEKAVTEYKNSSGEIGNYDAIERERLVLNDLADQINAGIRQYNSLAQSVNETIRDYNTNAGEEFNEGIYSPADNSIYIYQYDDKEALLRVLAHEFGHALGIDHTENPDSIMYRTNKSKSQILSPEDISAIKTLCQVS